MLFKRENTSFDFPILHPRMGVTFTFVLWSICVFNLRAQASGQGFPADDKDSVFLIEIVSPTDSSVFRVDGQEEIQELYGNVVVRHDSLFFRCDRAFVRNQETLRAYGNAVITKPDSIFVFADSILYNSLTGIAILYSEAVVMESGSLKMVASDSFILDTRRNVGYFTNRGFLLSDSSQISSIRGYYDFSSKLASMRDSVMMQSDSFSLVSDSIDYATDLDKVFFLGPTRMKDGGRSIYCEDGYYDKPRRKAFFSKNVQFVDEGRTGEADTMKYDGFDNVTILHGRATVVDSSVTARGDWIKYDDRLEVIYLRQNAELINDEGTISSNSMTYDLETEKLLSQSATVIDNEDFELETNALDFDNSTGISKAKDGVIWFDKKNQNVLYADELILIEDEEYVMAYGQVQPLLVVLNDGDSTFIRSDSLLRRRLDVPTEEVDTNASELRAYYDVEILGPGYYGVCDSLYYSDVDSSFQLIGNPIIWSDSAQIVGDSITFYLKEGSIDRAEVTNDASVMSYTTQKEFWNQVQGNRMDIFFRNDEIHSVYVDGNAESMYFAEDEEGRFDGCNHVMSSEMTIFFEEQKIDKIKFKGRSDGTFKSIMPNANGQDYRLDQIKDHFDLKPEDTLKRHPVMYRALLGANLPK